MNKAVLVIAVALMALAMLVTPVMAIGPWNAEEVGSNPNLVVKNGGLVNGKGNAGGSIVWALGTTGEYWVQWKWKQPTDAKGVMNSAVMVISLTQLAQVGTTDYDNEWIYLSGDDKPNYPNPYQFQFPLGSPYYSLGKHGMLWWLFFYAFKSVAAANSAATSFPNGALWMHNLIQD